MSGNCFCTNDSHPYNDMACSVMHITVGTDSSKDAGTYYPHFKSEDPELQRGFPAAGRPGVGSEVEERELFPNLTPQGPQSLTDHKKEQSGPLASELMAYAELSLGGLLSRTSAKGLGGLFFIHKQLSVVRSVS